MNRRGISPVIGTVILVVITILLASMFAVGFISPKKFEMMERQVDRVVDAGGPPGSGLVRADPNRNGVTSTHYVEYYIPNDSNTVGNSLNSVTVDYAGGVDLTDVDARDDIEKAGFDTDGDGTIDTDVTGDIECCPPSDGVIVSDSGTTLRVEFSGNYNTPGDVTFLMTYSDATNTNEGTYSVTVTINGDVSKTGNITIR